MDSIVTKKHDIHRTSLSSQCENCEVVPPHNNVRSQKSKGTYNQKKGKTTPLQSPHRGKIIGLKSNGQSTIADHNNALGPMSENERKARENSKNPQNIH